MPTPKEIKEANEWIKKHGRELPKTEDGERINYDPIIYFDPSEVWRFNALRLLRKNRELDSLLPHNDKRLLHVAFALKLLQVKMSLSQVVCLYGIIQGKSQTQLAKILGISQQAVAKHQSKALKLLTTKSKR